MSSSAFQYSIVRYVPNVIRDEPSNIGVVIRDQARSESGARFLPPAILSRKIGPTALALALAFEETLRGSVFGPVGSAPVLLHETYFDDALREFHGNIRFSALAGIIAPDITHALNRVFSTFVKEPEHPSQVRASSGPLSPFKMKQRLWSAFKKADVFLTGKARKDFPIQGRHAMWHFDVGYKNGAVSVINALAIGTATPQINLDRALLYKGMVLEVQEAAEQDVHATAVIPPPPDGGSECAYDEAQQILVDAGIVTYALEDVATLALQVRSEVNPPLFSRGMN
jgi:hypothetical protein